MSPKSAKKRTGEVRTTKSIRVVEVERDESDKAIKVRIQCYKKANPYGLNIEIVYHDVVFMPYGKWVRIQERILSGYIPHNRYHKMTEQAAAIIWEKK